MLFRWSARRALAGDIRSIELQANTDWPTEQITDPTRIREIKAWILSSHHSGALRSAPPAAVCEMSFHFADGRMETLPHSPFRARLSDQGWPDVRGDVLFRLDGYVRSASTEDLESILDSGE